MIIKGKSRATPKGLAAHLGNAEKNERVTLLEVRGTVAQDLRGALIEMDAYALATRCERSLYHSAISPGPPHRLTPEQRAEAIDALEAKLGFTGHSRVVVMHEKLGREHLHIVWSRINLEKLRSVSDSHNYRKHEEVARELERRFGHERVQGAHAERDGVKRPARTPSRAELRQEERTGIKGKDVRAEVTEMFRASADGKTFKVALEKAGYVLAKGDRRDFVIVDRVGGIHSLARRIEGIRAKELREFMASINRDDLPDGELGKKLAAQMAEERATATNYAHGEGYVSQSQAAQRDFAKRHEELNASADAIRMFDYGDPDAQTDDKAEKNTTKKDQLNGMSKARAARLERLARASVEARNTDDDPDRQHKAPGGGHTRSR